MAAASAIRKPGELFSDAVKQQLKVVFGRMAKPVTMQLELDKTPLSAELEGFVGEVAKLSGGKAVVAKAPESGADPSSPAVALDDTGRAVFDAAAVLPDARPCVRVLVDGKPTGLAFHGVPSGHEFNSSCWACTTRPDRASPSTTTSPSGPARSAAPWTS